MDRRGALVVMGAGLLLGATAVPAQVNVTVQPFMTKGPATAPVTIVEFSDYQ
jgi:protein-disulfide isomerase